MNDGQTTQDRKPFEADELITERVNALLALVKGAARGDFFSFAALESAADLVRYEGQWSATLDRFRKELLRRHGVTLQNERGAGYFIATVPQQIFDQSEDRTRRAMGQARRTVATLDAIPDDELTAHQRVARARIAEEARRAHSKGRANLRIMRTLFGQQPQPARERKRFQRKPAAKSKRRQRSRQESQDRAQVATG